MVSFIYLPLPNGPSEVIFDFVDFRKLLLTMVPGHRFIFLFADLCSRRTATYATVTAEFTALGIAQGRRHCRQLRSSYVMMFSQLDYRQKMNRCSMRHFL